MSAAACLRLIAPVLAIGLSLANAQAVELNPAAAIYQLPDQIKWQDPFGASGAKNAVLMGDPNKPGPYIVMVKWLPGNFSRPHFHPNDRFITVLKASGGSAPGRNSTRVKLCRCRPAPS